MSKKIITIISFLFVANIFSQDDLSLSDTNFTALETIDENFLDTADIAVDIDTIDTEIAETFDTIPHEIKKVSWYISLSPRVGVDEIQKEYSNFIKERADSLYTSIRRIDGMNSTRQTWFQPAAPSGVSFYLETGISAFINSKTTLGIGAGYSFSRMKSIYKVENSLDSTQILRAASLLANNSFSLSTNCKIAFDTSYFSIKEMDKAGFIIGASAILSRYSENDEISSLLSQFSQNRREKYNGFGGSARAGLFAQKNIGSRSVFEYSIGYLFAATSGYKEFWNRKFYWDNGKNSGKFLSISNIFELSFSLIF